MSCCSGVAELIRPTLKGQRPEPVKAEAGKREPEREPVKRGCNGLPAEEPSIPAPQTPPKPGLAGERLDVHEESEMRRLMELKVQEVERLRATSKAAASLSAIVLAERMETKIQQLEAIMSESRERLENLEQECSMPRQTSRKYEEFIEAVCSPGFSSPGRNTPRAAFPEEVAGRSWSRGSAGRSTGHSHGGPKEVAWSPAGRAEEVAEPQPQVAEEVAEPSTPARTKEVAEPSTPVRTKVERIEEVDEVHELEATPSTYATNDDTDSKDDTDATKDDTDTKDSQDGSDSSCDSTDLPVEPFQRSSSATSMESYAPPATPAEVSPHNLLPGRAAAPKGADGLPVAPPSSPMVFARSTLKKSVTSPKLNLRGLRESSAPNLRPLEHSPIPSSPASPESDHFAGSSPRTPDLVDPAPRTSLRAGPPHPSTRRAAPEEVEATAAPWQFKTGGSLAELASSPALPSSKSSGGENHKSYQRIPDFPLSVMCQGHAAPNRRRISL